MLRPYFHAAAISASFHAAKLYFTRAIHASIHAANPYRYYSRRYAIHAANIFIHAAVIFTPLCYSRR